MTFWTRQSKDLFHKRSAKNIDGNEKRNRVIWILNFRIRMFLKSAVICKYSTWSAYLCK